MGQLKKTNIYITGNRPPMENVVFGSPLTVTTQITDSEENQKHTWYKLTTPNPSSGNIHSYRSAKIEFTTTEDNIEVEFKIKAQTNWDGNVMIGALDYYTNGVIDADYIIATIYGNLTEKIIKYQVPTKGKHFIQFQYTKSSNNSGDGAYICAWSNLNMPISEVKSVYVENSKIQQMNVQGKDLFEYELGNTVSWKTMKYNKNTKQFTYDTNDTLYVSYSVSNKYTPAYLSNSPQELGIPMDRYYYYVKFQELNSYQTDYNGNTSYNLTYSLDLTDLVIPKKEKMFITWSNNYILDYTYLSSIVELYLPLEYIKNQTNLKSWLYNKSSLRKTNASDWDVSNVTYFGGNQGNNNEYGTFYGCKSLPSLDLSKWNTSKAVNLKGMFENCYSLSSIKFGNNWNTSKVKDTAKMFSYCKSLSSLDTNVLNTSNVTDMSNMFNGCSSLASLDLSNWNVTKLYNCNSMFNGCKLLETLNLSNWNTGGIYNVNSMFADCPKLTSLDLTGINVTGMEQDNYNYPTQYMFKNDNNLTTLIAGHETEENVSILNGLNNSIWLNKCKKLNYESVYALFRGLAQLTKDTRKYIYLPKAMEGKLNTDETLIASRKQWLIQYSDYAE